MGQYTAIIRQLGNDWIGWVREVPGVNAQGASRAELVENLQMTLEDMLQYYREKSLSGLDGPYEELSITA